MSPDCHATTYLNHQYEAINNNLNRVRNGSNRTEDFMPGHKKEAYRLSPKKASILVSSAILGLLILSACSSSETPTTAPAPSPKPVVVNVFSVFEGGVEECSFNRNDPHPTDIVKGTGSLFGEDGITKVLTTNHVVDLGYLKRIIASVSFPGEDKSSKTLNSLCEGALREKNFKIQIETLDGNRIRYDATQKRKRGEEINFGKLSPIIDGAVSLEVPSWPKPKDLQIFKFKSGPLPVGALVKLWKRDSTIELPISNSNDVTVNLKCNAPQGCAIGSDSGSLLTIKENNEDIIVGVLYDGSQNLNGLRVTK